MTLKKNLVNKKFGRLTVLEVHSKTRNGHIRYKCICDCGKEKNILSTHLLSGKIKSCGCIRKHGSSHPKWTGYGEISGNVWNEIVRSASGVKGKRKKIELGITIEYAWFLFLKQDRKCALSGIEIYFPERYNMNGTASLDRIDSSKGYIDGNVQWVHKDINWMKGSLEQEYFKSLCKFVTDYTEKREL